MINLSSHYIFTRFISFHLFFLQTIPLFLRVTFFTCGVANDFSMLQMIRLFSRDFFFYSFIFTRDFYAISLFCMFHLFIYLLRVVTLFIYVLFFFPHASSFYTIRFACVYLCIFRGLQSYVKCMAFFIRVKKKNIYRHVIKVNVFCPTTIMLPHEPVSSLSSLFSFFILFKTDRKPAF